MVATTYIPPSVMRKIMGLERPIDLFTYYSTAMIMTGESRGHARGVLSREGMPPACPAISPVRITDIGYYDSEE